MEKQQSLLQQRNYKKEIQEKEAEISQQTTSTSTTNNKRI